MPAGEIVHAAIRSASSGIPEILGAPRAQHALDRLLNEHADDRNHGRGNDGDHSLQLRPLGCGVAGRQHLPAEVARRGIGASRL
eukprot:8697944-Pyramimonas_sp.AAC.1